MSEEGEKKKVSIADALEQLRQGKASSDNKPSATHAAAAAASQQRSQRIPPAFWLQNLQDSIQRRRDTLFDKIVEDASGQAGMNRRDLVASESFYLPADMVHEMHKPDQTGQRVADVSRFQDVEILSLDAVAHENLQATPLPPSALPAHPVAQRFDGIETIDVTAMVEEIRGVASVPSAVGTRFEAVSSPEFLPLDGLEFEEVQTEQQETTQKKFRVNPMFRQMFQNLGNQNPEESEQT